MKYFPLYSFYCKMMFVTLFQEAPLVVASLASSTRNKFPRFLLGQASDPSDLMVLSE